MRRRDIVYTVIISAIVTSCILALVFGVPMLQQSYKDAELQRLISVKGTYVISIKTENVKVYEVPPEDAKIWDHLNATWAIHDKVQWVCSFNTVGEEQVETLWFENVLSAPITLSLQSNGVPLARYISWNYTNSVLQPGAFEVIELYASLPHETPLLSFDVTIKAVLP